MTWTPKEDDVTAHQLPNGNGSSAVWKWVSAILATILLAGAPGYLYLYLNTPSKGEFNQVEERQQDVLQRLAVVESQRTITSDDLDDMQTAVAALQEEVDVLRSETQRRP